MELKLYRAVHSHRYFDYPILEEHAMEVALFTDVMKIAKRNGCELMIAKKSNEQFVITKNNFDERSVGETYYRAEEINILIYHTIADVAEQYESIDKQKTPKDGKNKRGIKN